MKQNLVSVIAKEVASELGLHIQLEDSWGYVGQITLPNGERRYFRNTSLDINKSAAAEVARDKSYSAFFMEKMGYRTPEGKTFLSPTYSKQMGQHHSLALAFSYAEEIGFPLIVKPNSGAQGKGVTKVRRITQLTRAIENACVNDDIFIIQKLIPGTEYRLCVIDDSLELIYKRMPMIVIGDGQTSLEVLVEEKVNQVAQSGIRLDENLLTMLKRTLISSGYKLSSVVPENHEVVVTDTSNLSRGGTIESIEKGLLHSTWRTFATKLCGDMGLRFCGIDIMTDSDPSNEILKPVILEINAAPGFYHYAAESRTNMDEVRTLYRKVIKKMCEH